MMTSKNPFITFVCASILTILLTVPIPWSDLVPSPRRVQARPDTRVSYQTREKRWGVLGFFRSTSKTEQRSWGTGRSLERSRSSTFSFHPVVALLTGALLVVLWGYTLLFWRDSKARATP